MRAWKFMIASKRLEGSEHAHRHDGAVDLITVRPMPERAGCNLPSGVRVPSGNKMMRAAGEQAVQDFPQTRRAAAIAIHRHGVPRTQQRADARDNGTAFRARDN